MKSKYYPHYTLVVVNLCALLFDGGGRRKKRKTRKSNDNSSNNNEIPNHILYSSVHLIHVAYTHYIRFSERIFCIFTVCTGSAMHANRKDRNNNQSRQQVFHSNRKRMPLEKKNEEKAENFLHACCMSVANYAKREKTWGSTKKGGK